MRYPEVREINYLIIISDLSGAVRYRLHEVLKVREVREVKL